MREGHPEPGQFFAKIGICCDIADYKDLVQFAQSFRKMKSYNAMLLYVQQSGYTFVASASIKA